MIVITPEDLEDARICARTAEDPETRGTLLDMLAAEGARLHRESQGTVSTLAEVLRGLLAAPSSPPEPPPVARLGDWVNESRLPDSPEPGAVARKHAATAPAPTPSWRQRRQASREATAREK